MPVILRIIQRLPAQSVLCLRAVCRAWRDVTSNPALVATLHLLQPPHPLICFTPKACCDPRIPLKDYNVEALDLRSDRLRSIVRFTDRKGGNGNRSGSSDEEFPKGIYVVHYLDTQEYDLDFCDPELPELEYCNRGLTIHASLDGTLLVSFNDDWYLCNPATRQWAPILVPELNLCVVVGLYFISGEFRVLYHSGRDSETDDTCYYVLTVGSGEGRSIGCPISPDAVADVGLNIGLEASELLPPVQIGLKLFWPPQDRQSYYILMFDAEAEVFNWVRPALGITRHLDMRLLEMIGPKLGMSISRTNQSIVRLWRLDDYRKSIWNPVYKIQLQVVQMTDLDPEGWIPYVVSPEGDVLIECPHFLFHCDRKGKLLRKFRFPEKIEPVRHVLKPSLLRHGVFARPKPDDAREPPFFRGL